MNVIKRRLVELAGSGSDYAEVDNIRLKRETEELLAYIQNHVDLAKDEHEIWRWIVPMCKDVLEESISLPVPFSELPLKYEVREGRLQPDFQHVFAEFALTISGTAREILDEVVIDGIRYMHADFEY